MVTKDTRIVKINGRNRRPWALQSRENLLRAATEEIAQVGFDKAKLVDIARRAEMTAGSVYTWFENKEDLFRAALEDALDAQLSSNADALNELPDLEDGHWITQLAALVPRNHRNTGPTNAQRLLIESFYSSWRDKKVARKVVPRLREHVGMYVSVIQRAQAAGKIRPEFDAQVLGMMLVAVPLGMAIMNLAGMERIEDSSWAPLVVGLHDIVKP